MNISDLISDLRIALGDVKRGGNATVDVVALEKYLIEIEDISSEEAALEARANEAAALEARVKARKDFESNIELVKLTHASEIEGF